MRRRALTPNLPSAQTRSQRRRMRYTPTCSPPSASGRPRHAVRSCRTGARRSVSQPERPISAQARSALCGASARPWCTSASSSTRPWTRTARCRNWSSRRSRRTKLYTLSARRRANLRTARARSTSSSRPSTKRSWWRSAAMRSTFTSSRRTTSTSTWRATCPRPRRRKRKRWPPRWPLKRRQHVKQPRPRRRASSPGCPGWRAGRGWPAWVARSGSSIRASPACRRACTRVRTAARATSARRARRARRVAPSGGAQAVRP
mmetsp:Transcript_10963/g.29408  ORF Transcript_10963/g.29408 Transcript_10963/m.29408 type:complete len:261 (+) Transcript_10963:660-1442(+)